MPPKRNQREPDRGLRFLEEKLSIYANGPAQTRRNHALDLLTGRVADERVPETFGALALTPEPIVEPKPNRTPPTIVLPQVRNAPRPIATSGVAEFERPRASVWVEPAAETRARLRLVAPPPKRRSLIPGRGMLGLVFVAAVVGVGAGIAVRAFAPQQTPTEIVVSAPVVSVATVAPEPAPTAPPEPTRPPLPTASASAPVETNSKPVVAAAPAPSDQFTVLLDERFSSNARGWLDQPNGTAYYDDGAYHLEPRVPGKFVAVSVPGVQDLQDVVLSATFRKVKGPDGGGYGLIVRDQHAGLRDGQSQAGRFYVFEIGDRGELGVWLRDGDAWVDLLPWTQSDVVKPGSSTNELTVSAIGDRLSFMVNGIPVASQRDSMLQRGGLGVFTGGDGNHVALERLTVRVPR